MCGVCVVCVCVRVCGKCHTQPTNHTLDCGGEVNSTPNYGGEKTHGEVEDDGLLQGGLEEGGLTGPGSQQQVSVVTQGLMAVGQRFRNAPPTLLRRMGVVSGRGQNHVTQTPPPELLQNDISDSIKYKRKVSKSSFIVL